MAGGRETKPPDKKEFLKSPNKEKNKNKKSPKKSATQSKTTNSNPNPSQKPATRQSTGGNSPFTHLSPLPPQTQNTLQSTAEASCSANGTPNTSPTLKSATQQSSADFTDLLVALTQLDPIKKLAISKALNINLTPPKGKNPTNIPPGFPPLPSSPLEFSNSEAEMNVSDAPQNLMDISFTRPKSHLRLEAKRKRRHSKNNGGNTSDEEDSLAAAKKPKAIPHPKTTKNQNKINQTKAAPSKTSSSSQVMSKEAIRPLFVDKKDTAKLEYIFAKVKEFIKHSRFTQNGNLLIYPKSKDASASLLKIESQEFKIRETKGSQVQKRPTPPPQTTAVVKGVSKYLTDDDFKNLTGLECKRIISAATNLPTTLMRIKCKNNEEKENLIRNGLSLNFGRKLVVVDYKPNNPLQCTKCLGFGHRATSCPSELTCKKCAAKGHSAKDCTKPEETAPKCANCSGEHPATYSACPALQQAKRNAEGANLIKHQKISKPAEPLQATRLATCISYCIIATLQPYIEQLDCRKIINTVKNTVNLLYKAQINTEHIHALLPQPINKAEREDASDSESQSESEEKGV